MVSKVSNVSCYFYHSVKESCNNVFIAIFKKTVEPFIGYFLKVCLFREAMLKGNFGKWVILPVTSKIGNIWLRCQGFPSQFKTFDQDRINKSTAFLAQFGETTFIQADDGKQIKMTCYLAEKFEDYISKFKNTSRENGMITPTIEQEKLIEFLSNFKFKQTSTSTFYVPKKLVGADKKCILRLNGFGLPIETDKKLIGQHLAAGFNYAIFEWGDDVSIKGLCNDAVSAYSNIKTKFPPKDVKILSYCGTTYIASCLKKEFHSEGLDVVEVAPHTSFRDVVDHTLWPARMLGKWGMGAIEKEGLDFDNIKKFRALNKNGSSTCLIMNPKNEITPDDTVEHLKEALSNTDYEIIVKPDNITENDFNFNKQFEIPEIWDKYTTFLLRNQEGQFR